MELTNEKLAILDERSHWLTKDAVYWLKNQHAVFGPTPARCKDMLYVVGELATALLARQRLAAEVEAFLVLLRSGAGREDDETIEQIEALEEILGEDQDADG